MVTGKSDLVDLELVPRDHSSTERAWAVDDPNKDFGLIFLPKSLIERDDNTYTMPSWLALEKGLI